jgi:hypothetical protein
VSAAADSLRAELGATEALTMVMFQEYGDDCVAARFDVA